jgi:hypothetical protein
MCAGDRGGHCGAKQDRRAEASHGIRWAKSEKCSHGMHSLLEKPLAGGEIALEIEYFSL